MADYEVEKAGEQFLVVIQGPLGKVIVGNFASQAEAWSAIKRFTGREA